MARFKGISTMNSYDEHDIWPDVCSECKINLVDSHRSGCNVCRSGQPVCRSGQPQTAGNTDEFEDNEFDNDVDKRPCTTSSRHDDEEGREREAKPAVTRSPVQDFRERPPETRDHGGRQSELAQWERRNRRHNQEGTRATRADQVKSGHKVDPQRALENPRCHDELRLRAGYTHDLDKYMESHNRLFTMDHYSPYGPWSAEFEDWDAFQNGLFRSPKGTTAMDANIVMEVA